MFMMNSRPLLFILLLALMAIALPQGMYSAREQDEAQTVPILTIPQL